MQNLLMMVPLGAQKSPVECSAKIVRTIITRLVAEIFSC